MKRTLFMLLFVSCFAPTPDRWEYTAKVPMGDLLDAIAMKETGNRPHRKGKDGEQSAYQIMPYVLAEYNKSHDQAYTMSDLVHSDLKARQVASWAVMWFWWRFSKVEDCDLRLVYTVSAFNNGYLRPMKGIIKYSYVQDVIPSVFEEVTNRYGYDWKGTRLMKLKGAKNGR